MKYKTGVIGVGMVGGALSKVLPQPFLYDNNKKLGSIKGVNQADIIFICVPTPYDKKKGFDLSFVQNAFKIIKGNKIVIIKSTVLPGTTEMFQKKYPRHKILFNPEFLTEQTSDQDMKYPDRQIIGYTKKSYNIAGDILKLLPLAPFERIIPAFVAEFCKYGGNTWFSVKVSKNNELYDLFEAFGGSDEEFELLIDSIAADKRIGRSHLDIFHKGYRGYGDTRVSKCLPKDTKALLKFASELKIKMPVLEAADKYNDKLVRQQNLRSIEESKRDNS